MKWIIAVLFVAVCLLAISSCAEEGKDSESGGDKSKEQESSGQQGNAGGKEGEKTSGGKDEEKGKNGGDSGSKDEKGKEGGDSGSKEDKGKNGGDSGSNGDKGKEGGDSGSKEDKGKDGGDSGSKDEKGKDGGDSGSKEDKGKEAKGNESSGNDTSGGDKNGVAEEICGKGQGDSKPESTKEKKEETEAEENKDDKKDKKFFYAGDMRITEKQKEELDRARQTGQKRQATKRSDAKWPNSTVYYEVDNRMNKEAKEAIDGAIRDIEEYTCISFVKKVDRSIEHFVKFISQQGCWSYVGMLNKRALRAGYKQEISLGRGCEYKGTAIHEILHALGFEHEHSRPDRDKFVKINFANIESRNKYNFDINTNTIDLGVAYDYNSIMHYPDWAFSTNGKPTIEAVGKTGGAEIGQRDGMTAGDIEQINKYYKCEQDSKSGKGGSFTKILKRDTKPDKKPKDKKGGKCEAQFESEQKNKERKMAWKESLMRQQEENMKKMEEEEKLANMLKRRKKH